MNSPPHRENLLDPDYVDVGFGSANNPNYTSAGGGPMTIVVAFYGQLQSSAPTPVAPASTTPTSTPPASQSTAPVASETPPATSRRLQFQRLLPTTPAIPASKSNAASSTKPKPQEPVTYRIQQLRVNTAILSNSLKAQLAFAHGCRNPVHLGYILSRLIAGIAANWTMGQPTFIRYSVEFWSTGEAFVSSSSTH